MAPGQPENAMAGVRSFLARLNPVLALVKAAFQTAGRSIRKGLPLIFGEVH
jgi:hypothetical protein